MSQKDQVNQELTTDNEIASSVASDFNKAYRTKLPKEILFKEVYHRYRSYLDIQRYTNRSTLFIPESFTIIETITPRMTAKKPTWKVVPRKSQNISQADGIGYLLEYYYDRMRFHPKLKLFVKQGLIYGTSFVKMGWDTEEEIPIAEPVDIADIFGDPRTPDWQTGFIIHRYYMKVDELKKSKVKYKNLELIKDQKDTRARDDILRQDRASIQAIPYDGEHDGVEILEWWGRVDGEIRVRAVANRSVLIRDDKNPLPVDKYPFVVFFDQPVPFEKWGIGEIEPIMDLQDEENTTRNQRIDEKNLSIHNMWLVNKMAGVDYRNLVSRPGGIILANDINGVKALEKQNITQDSIQELNLIKSDIENTTGVNDFIKGGDTNTTTATETMSKTQESNQRFMEKISNLEISLKEIGEWLVALAAEFMTDSLKIQILGKFGYEELKIIKKDVKGEYDIDIETGSSLPANPDLRRQQLGELIKNIAPFLVNPNGLPDGMLELVRNYIQAFDLKNADEILQGAQHPLVDQAMANLQDGEMQGINPQMVQEAIRRKLMAGGHLNPIAQQQQQQQAQEQQKQQQSQNRPPSTQISFKDLPPDGKVQLAAEAGIQLSPESVQIPVTPATTQPQPNTIG